MWRPHLVDTARLKYLGIVDALEADIRAGRVTPGERLPPQRAIAEALGVDLTTVTRALNEAQRRGLVSAQVGRGTFVRDEPAGDEGGGTPLDLSMNIPPQPAEPDLRRILPQGIASILTSPRGTLAMHYQESTGAPADRTAAASLAGRTRGRSLGRQDRRDQRRAGRTLRPLRAAARARRCRGGRGRDLSRPEGGRGAAAPRAGAGGDGRTGHPPRGVRGGLPRAGAEAPLSHPVDRQSDDSDLAGRPSPGGCRRGPPPRCPADRGRPLRTAALRTPSGSGGAGAGADMAYRHPLEMLHAGAAHRLCPCAQCRGRRPAGDGPAVERADGAADLRGPRHPLDHGRHADGSCLCDPRRKPPAPELRRVDLLGARFCRRS